MSNFFLRDTESYQRNYDIQTAYYNDMAKGLSRRTGRSFEECLAYVKRVTDEGGRLEFKDKPMKYVGRKTNGDREFRITSFLGYINIVEKHNLIMSPSMTVYKPKEVDVSPNAQYIRKNIKKRKKSKKEMFQAKEAGNAALNAYKDNEQQTFKIKNNALSGAHSSASTVLFIDTIHSSLTSTCRSATGYGNANNEKVISGNRHYWSYDVVEANILHIINNVDLDEYQKMMDQYGLRHPTVEETMECIDRSTEYYTKNPKRRSDTQALIESLLDVERSAVVYTGDLYHIRKYNSDMMRTFIDRLAVISEESVENPKQYINSVSEEMAALVSLFCGKWMEGKSLASFDDFSPELQNKIGATAKHLNEQLEDYRLFIKVILVSDIIPASMASLPTIVRRCAVTSDTDSTIYTIQEWLQWYGGKISFDEKLVMVGHTVSFLASSMIAHILAIMSANMGIAKDQLHDYAMKSEYYFPVFAVTTRAKTYFALMGAQEGQVFEENELELKGAVLKGSNSPAFIMSEVKNFILKILNTAYEDKKISLNEALKTTADLERKIRDSILSGDTTFYKSGEIKNADGYKKEPERSPYFHYLLWEEVFAPKYGHVDEPPYGAIKMSIDAKNKTEFQAWLESIEDPGIKHRLIEFMRKYGRTEITTIMIPKPIVELSGVPQELIQGVAIRKIISNLMEPMYVCLEVLGYYSIDSHQSRLVSDQY